MAGVRSMLTRVRRLEQVRTPVLSPIVQAFGSFDAFTAWTEEQVEAGALDPRDMPVVVSCLARWERDGTWGNTWALGGAWGRCR